MNMRIRLDSTGRVIIPKPLRDQLGLSPGCSLEICTRDGQVVIEPVPTIISLVRKRKRLVARPATELPTLTQKEVRAVLDGSRRKIRGQ